MQEAGLFDPGARINGSFESYLGSASAGSLLSAQLAESLAENRLLAAESSLEFVFNETDAQGRSISRAANARFPSSPSLTIVADSLTSWCPARS